MAPAAAPASAPRRVLVRSNAIAATVTTARRSGTPGEGNDRNSRRSQPAPRPPPRARRQPARLLAGPRRLPALLPSLLPALAHRARARAGERPRDLRGQPPLVPGPVRDRHDRPPADVLRGQGGAVPQPPVRLVAERARRVPRPPRAGRHGHAADRAHDPG